MKTDSTEGIVLHSRETGEGDLLSTVYTEQFGLIGCIFKGIKKIRRRSLASSEQGSLSHFTIPRIHLDGFSIVQDSSVIDLHDRIRQSLPKIVHLNYLSELVMKTTPPHTRDDYLFRMFRAALDTLETSEHDHHLSLFFTLHLLRIHGILPSMKSCNVCGRDSNIDYHLSITEKALFCAVCAKIPRGSFLAVSNAERLFAIHALSRKYSACNTDMITSEEASSLLFALVVYTEHYFHSEINSKRFLFSDELLESEPDIM